MSVLEAHTAQGDFRDTRVRQIDVPHSARELCTLDHIDYADAFLVDVTDASGRTAEQWSRAIFDDAPEALRLRLWWAWMMLGLRLGSPFDRRRVLGWKIVRRTPDHVLLGARSWIGMPAQLLVKREGDGLLLDTFVQKNNPVARAAWARIEPTHERFVPAFLRQFRRRVSAQG